MRANQQRDQSRLIGNAGHWAKGKPLCAGKGVNFNGLLPSGLECVDVISSGLDQCAPLKVYKSGVNLQSKLFLIRSREAIPTALASFFTFKCGGELFLECKPGRSRGGL